MGDVDDARAVQGLIERALANDDEDNHSYWAVVRELQQRDSRVTLNAMVDLCKKNSEASQRLGLNVLAQLGFRSGRPFLEESLPVVLAFCDPNLSAPVLVDAIAALGHLHDLRGLEPVLRCSTHRDADVRFQVASSLPYVAGDPPDPRAVDALIILMGDGKSEVRDWATFGLGTQLDVDSESVREALLTRMRDPDGDTAGEALVGLATRGDQRVIDEIRALLGSPTVGNLIVEAAAKMGD